MDVKTVILYGLILIYIKISHKLKKKFGKNMVYQLLKTHYDLKQSFQPWYTTLSNCLLQKLNPAYTFVNYSILL